MLHPTSNDVLKFVLQCVRDCVEGYNWTYSVLLWILASYTSDTCSRKTVPVDLHKKLVRLTIARVYFYFRPVLNRIKRNYSLFRASLWLSQQQLSFLFSVKQNAGRSRLLDGYTVHALRRHRRRLTAGTSCSYSATSPIFSRIQTYCHWFPLFSRASRKRLRMSAATWCVGNAIATSGKSTKLVPPCIYNTIWNQIVLVWPDNAIIILTNRVTKIHLAETSTLVRAF